MSAVFATAPLLSVRRLKVYHPLPQRWPWTPPAWVRAVDDVHFNLNGGETLGIAGESGCGKSTLARALVGLQPLTSGGIRYGNQDLAGFTREQWRPLRREIQMVFKNPIASLDPRMTIGDSLTEPLRTLFPELDEAQRNRRVAALLERVGLPSAVASRYPPEFSGGECQRIGLARALIA
ncbi:MAG: ATP-binding cassette domain-containing protein, partial [Pseudonocardiaceae bacterium]